MIQSFSSNLISGVNNKLGKASVKIVSKILIGILIQTSLHSLTCFCLKKLQKGLSKIFGSSLKKIIAKTLISYSFRFVKKDIQKQIKDKLIKKKRKIKNSGKAFRKPIKLKISKYLNKFSEKISNSLKLNPFKDFG